MEILEWMMRGFGLFWMVGGVMVWREALQTKVYDDFLLALTNEKQEKLTNYYGYAVGTLTFLSGVALLTAHPFAPYIIGVLVLTQGLYFALKHRLFLNAQSDEERKEFLISPQSKNAFFVSLVVMVLSMVLSLR